MLNKYTPRPAIFRGDKALLPLGVGAKDGYATVDKEFAYLDQYKWRLQKGYAIGWIGHKDVLLHRFILNAEKGMAVDHINHDTLDNRLSNLRQCTQRENMRNMKKVSKSSAGYKGVSFYKRDQNYSAHITLDYKKKHIGYFKTALEAAKAYDEKARELFGEYANLNFKEI